MDLSSIWIYHITPYANLAGIIETGGLFANHTLKLLNAGYIDIAHPHIQERRSRRHVPCGQRGNLHDYVPFYFAPRSPMLYAHFKKNVATYQDGQEEIIYLVSTVATMIDANIPFVFTDGHAAKEYTLFFDDINKMDQVDWSIMAAKMWTDTADDNDRQRRRQAEFLVHNFFDWRYVKGIGVINAEMAAKVQNLLKNSQHTPPVRVMRDWYFGR